MKRTNSYGMTEFTQQQKLSKFPYEEISILVIPYQFSLYFHDYAIQHTQ